MQRAVLLRVGVTIKQSKKEHLQNLLDFQIGIRGHCPRIPPVATGLLLSGRSICNPT